MITLYLNKTTAEQFRAWLKKYGQETNLKEFPFPFPDAPEKWLQVGTNVNELDDIDVIENIENLKENLAKQFRASLTYTQQEVNYKEFPKFTVFYPSNVSGNKIDVMVNIYRIQRVPEGERTRFYNLYNMLKIEWLEVGERLKVTISHESGMTLPVIDLLTALSNDWIETRSDIEGYKKHLGEQYGVKVDTPSKPVKTQKRRRGEPPNRTADLKKWAGTYEFYDKHCGMEKKNARAFRVFFENYDGWDKQTVWMPQDDETLQAIIDNGRAGKIPKYSDIK